MLESTQEYFYKRLGELLKEARMKANVKQETLADFLGLSRISVVYIEQGKQKVQLHTLLEIISFLNIPMNQFFEQLKSALLPELNPTLEKRLNQKIDIQNSTEANILREFIQFSIAKREK